MKTRKKLIEVALPLEAINKASAREKSIRHGHPSTLHLWWARRPLAAARAVIFAQMVDDPSTYVDTLLADSKLRRKAESVLKVRRKRWEEATETARKAKEAGIDAPEPGDQPMLEEIAAELERERLFKIIEDLVQWENTTNETVLQAARDEIWQSWRRTCAENADHPKAKELFDRHKLPAFHDPFAGGGALPMEAQRLGLESHASDLNPVAVLINKAMIEIPPKFAGRPPVNPEARKDKRLFEKEWKSAQGLAEDVRHYGKWMRDEAENRIGHLYPKMEITEEMALERPALKPLVGQKLTVIAWLWARTVKSPNPAFSHVDVPLASNFLLSTKVGREMYLEPVLENGGYRFAVRAGKASPEAKLGTTLGKRAAFRCVMSGTPIDYPYIRSEGRAGRLGQRLMAVVVEGASGRVYLPPTSEVEAVAAQAKPEWMPTTRLPEKHRSITAQLYGLDEHGKLFNPRQLVALTTFSDLITEVREVVMRDASQAQQRGDGTPEFKNDDSASYADAIAVYLAFSLSRSADRGSSLCSWDSSPKMEALRATFGRQSIAMVWDFAEGNPFSESSGNWMNNVEWVAKAIASFPGRPIGEACQADAAHQDISVEKVVSTDPPYYDNIGYADLSDFFYAWLRRSLRSIFPQLFATLAVPKAEELIADAFRHGSKDKAEAFFLQGMTDVMQCLASQAHRAFPVTIYYAFKQSENSVSEGVASTGWETFLDAVIRAGFGVTGTWPMRTELTHRMVGAGTNALASSIVLVCRPRPASAPVATRREFLATLKAELPKALSHLQHGNIAPVDLAQAAIGPGMGVYTRYERVLDANGKPLTVRDALALINQTLDEALAEQEGDFDADSRWALSWFEQHGFDEGLFGLAETLSKAKNTSVDGLRQAGILFSSGGKVRLKKPSELPADWDPTKDPRLTTWEMVHHLIRALESGGEAAAAALVTKLGTKAETARELCYRLYTLCERKKRAEEALSYNALVLSWPEIVRLARETRPSHADQGTLFDESEA